MNCNEDCVLAFGESSNDEDVKALKRFLLKMRTGLARSIRRDFRVEVVHYKFISRNGIVVVDQVRDIDISMLFEFSSRDSSSCNLYTHHGLVATDLLLMLKEEHLWDGYRLEVALRGMITEGESEGFLEVA